MSTDYIGLFCIFATLACAPSRQPYCGVASVRSPQAQQQGMPVRGAHSGAEIPGAVEAAPPVPPAAPNEQQHPTPRSEEQREAHPGLAACEPVVLRSGTSARWLALQALGEIDAGRLDDAEVLAKVALREADVSLTNNFPGAEDAKTWALHAFGSVSVSRGKFARAIEPLSEAVQRHIRARGEADTVVSAVYLTLAAAYRGTGRHKEAAVALGAAAKSVSELCPPCKLETEAVIRRHCKSGYQPACLVHAEVFGASNDDTTR